METRLTGSNHKTAAAWNRGLVLRLLRQHGQLSRRQVVEMVGLRGSTLTYIMRELMDLDIVRTAGKLASKRVGQKQVMLTINPDVGWAVGVGLGEGVAALAFVDAAGRPLAERVLEIGYDLHSLPDRLHAGVRQWLAAHGTPPGRLLGLGVGVPAVVDTRAGVVVRSTKFKAVGVPLRKTLTDRFGVISVIDHDACFGARVEAAEGASANETHFLYLVINHVVRGDTAVINSYGSAFYLGGTVYRGAHFAAGELIDTLAPPEIPLDAADLAVLDTAAAPLTPGLADLAAAIARPLAMIVNLVDVRMVVLAGTVNIANDAFLTRVRALVRSQGIDLPGRDLNIVPATARGGAVARGAALAALAASDETFADSRLSTVPHADAAAANGNESTASFDGA